MRAIGSSGASRGHHRKFHAGSWRHSRAGTPSRGWPRIPCPPPRRRASRAAPPWPPEWPRPGSKTPWPPWRHWPLRRRPLARARGDGKAGATSIDHACQTPRGRPRGAGDRGRRTPRPTPREDSQSRIGERASVPSGGRRRCRQGRCGRFRLQTRGTAGRERRQGERPGQGPSLELNRRENQDRYQAGRHRTPCPGAPFPFSLRSTQAFQLLPAAVSLPGELDGGDVAVGDVERAVAPLVEELDEGLRRIGVAIEDVADDLGSVAPSRPWCCPGSRRRTPLPPGATCSR